MISFDNMLKLHLNVISEASSKTHLQCASPPVSPGNTWRGEVALLSVVGSLHLPRKDPMTNQGHTCTPNTGVGSRVVGDQWELTP